MEASLNKRLDSVFEWFDEKPLGAASIGQVHRATLTDGRDVVVKVVRVRRQKNVKLKRFK